MAAAVTRNPSVAAEGFVLMTPSGQGPRARVGQGLCAPEVQRHVPMIVSGPVEVGGRRNKSGRGEEEDAFTMAAAMLTRGGRRWGDRNGEEEEVEDDNSVTVAALGGVGRQNGGFDESSMTPTRQREAR